MEDTCENLEAFTRSVEVPSPQALVGGSVDERMRQEGQSEVLFCAKKARQRHEFGVIYFEVVCINNQPFYYVFFCTTVSAQM